MGEFMNITPVEIWLLVGVIFILIEFSTIPGIGFLFVGFGSLSNAILIYNYPQLAEYHIAAVGILSMLWFLILWWPLKVYAYGKKGKKKDYFDIAGSEVKVFDDVIKPGDMGQVEWSGTIMNARLQEHEEQAAQVGQTLYIIKVQGNILICSRTKPKA
jgi:membrane protein implicated in regulation of membrane protease activity